MKLSSETKEIVINVAPERAVVAMGLLVGLLDSFVENMRNTKGDSAVPFDDSILKDMHRVIGEVFDRCLEQTNLRERVQNLIVLHDEYGDAIFSTEEN